MAETKKEPTDADYNTAEHYVQYGDKTVTYVEKLSSVSFRIDWGCTEGEFKTTLEFYYYWDN